MADARKAAARIEELEQKLRAQEKQALKPAAGAPRSGKKLGSAGGTLPAASLETLRGRGKPANRDPGDAVPPGVAVEEPSPLDVEARSALENLEATLHPPND